MVTFRPKTCPEDRILSLDAADKMPVSGRPGDVLEPGSDVPSIRVGQGSGRLGSQNLPVLQMLVKGFDDFAQLLERDFEHIRF